MDLSSWPEWLQLIVVGLASLMTVSTIIVGMTKTKKDDEWLNDQIGKPIIGAVWKFLIRFSGVIVKVK